MQHGLLKLHFSGLETRIAGPGKFFKHIKLKGKNMKCMTDSKENKHRDLGIKRVIHELESPGNS